MSKIFHKTHLLFFLGLLLVEIAIAKYEFHPIIRSFIGDVLIIPLLYSFIRSFWSFKSEGLVLYILLFAFGIEALQLFELAKVLGVESKILKIIIGTTFDPWDLIAYGFGALLVIFIKNQQQYGAN